MTPQAVRLTVRQAVVKLLATQYSERDGVEQRLIPGVFGSVGHGNVKASARLCFRSNCSPWVVLRLPVCGSA